LKAAPTEFVVGNKIFKAQNYKIQGSKAERAIFKGFQGLEI
jgi:hypothetical protein